MAKLTIFMGLDNALLERAVVMGRDASTGTRSVRWPESTNDEKSFHPARHGHVADLFISASERTPHVLCTHSDVFVLRVRRRIAEGTLSPSDVALVWVEADGTERHIFLNDRGTPEWWPKGVGNEAGDEFHAIRRALTERDRKREEMPTGVSGRAAANGTEGE
jgi:hypothetical protein